MAILQELTREVHTLRRQLDAYENKHSDDAPQPMGQNSPARGGSAPHSLQHSRTNSTSSLKKPDSWVIVNQSQQRQGSPENTRPTRKPETMEAVCDKYFLFSFQFTVHGKTVTKNVHVMCFQ